MLLFHCKFLMRDTILVTGCQRDLTVGESQTTILGLLLSERANKLRATSVKELIKLKIRMVPCFYALLGSHLFNF